MILLIAHMIFVFLGKLFKMISLTKFVLAIFVICFAAALPFDDESPWEGLFNYEDE